MKQLVVRGVVALGLVASLGLTSAAVASAGGISVSGGRDSGSTATIQKAYHQALEAYKNARAAIEATFRTDVAEAHSTYQKALAASTTSAERSAAQQTMEEAIIQAASIRSSALTLLGNPPTDPI